MNIPAQDLFDPALRRMRLLLEIGGREAGPSDIAARLLPTLTTLEELDRRPIEWIHVGHSARSSITDESLPRTIENLATRVANGARHDDAGNFHPSWGYYLSILGFLEGTSRAVCPFDVTVSDGEQMHDSMDSFTLRFESATISGREALTTAFSELVSIWQPKRGGIFGLQVARLHRDDPLWYPQVGTITYVADEEDYALPPSPLVELRSLEHGTLAVLNDWTLKAVLTYQEEFRAVNEGVPKRRGNP